jgi:hypothetical protein
VNKKVAYVVSVCLVLLGALNLLFGEGATAAFFAVLAIPAWFVYSVLEEERREVINERNRERDK